MIRAVRIALVSFACLGMLAVVSWAEFYARPHVRKLVAMEGRTEAEALATLGLPDKAYEKASAPAHYYVSGYAYEERPIDHKVLIYVHGEHIGYLYVSQSNRVDHVFVGGS